MTADIKKNGFSLLEIMIALSIGLVLIGTLLMIVSQTRASYNVVTALANIQENGRFAFVFLSNAIQRAKTILVYPHDHLPINFQGQVISGSDVLVVQHEQDREAYFVANTHRLNERGQSIYALYEKKYLPGVETMRRELVSGVDSMHIYFNSGSKKIVQLLFIDLYLNSIEPLAAGLVPFIYTHDADSFFAKDLRLHRQWPVPILLKHQDVKYEQG